MGCNSCEYLKEKDKKEGNCGSLYMCCSKKKYVSGAGAGCDKYKLDIMRKTSTKDEIYRNGTKFSNDKTEVGTYLLVLVALIILGLFFGVFHF